MEIDSTFFLYIYNGVVIYSLFWVNYNDLLWNM